MIDGHLYLSFVVATGILMLIPGPNVALIVGNSVVRGVRQGLLTVAGTSSAMALQLVLTAAGMSALLGTLAAWFEWIRWAGVAYLIYLGVKTWRAPTAVVSASRRGSGTAAWARGFLISLTNPKTLLFYGAFFPQFMTNQRAYPQLLLLCATFLIMAVVCDSAWALLADRARPFLDAHVRLRNRLSGGLMIVAGVGLALARRK
jgi:homoserine/homoserine lactone efflux protein